MTTEPEISAPAPVIAPVSVKDSGMAELWEICMKCEACSLCKTRHSVVFGEGDPHARLMFIGEGPGADEDQQGRPLSAKPDSFWIR